MFYTALNHPSKTWRADRLSPVEAVAERAATAMNNVRLFRVAHKYTGTDRLIFEASTKISHARNNGNILRNTAQAVERVLGGSKVLIQFQNREQK